MNQIKKKIAIVTIAIFLLIMNIPSKQIWNDDIASNVEAAAPSKPTGSTGSISITAVAEPVVANPAVYWTQLDDLNFEAKKDGGKVSSPNSGNNTPLKKVVNNTLDLTDYNMPTIFSGSDGKDYNRSELTEYYLNSEDVEFSRAKESFNGISIRKVNSTTFTFITETGEPLTYTTRTQYGTNKDGKPKYTVRYDTPIRVTWRGKIEKQAEMRIVEDSSLPVASTKNYKAQVRTSNGGSWSNWKDVSPYQWKSDNTSVATVSSSGLVTTKAIGEAKITATWKDDTFHLEASANMKVIGKDGLAITGTSNACFKDKSTTLKAELYKNGIASDVTNTATWTSSDTSVATVSKGVVTFVKEGSATIKATSGTQTQTFLITISDCSSTTKPIEDEEPEYPPEVTIFGPTKVKAGEEFYLFASASVKEGTIEQYIWDYPEADGGEPNGANLNHLYYLTEGEKLVLVSVEDNKGSWAGDDHVIEVVPPTPVASMNVNGLLKENRKVTINSQSSSPTHFPITESYFTIEPLDGQDSNSIYTKSTKVSRANNILKVSDESYFELLFKEKGDYKVYHYVENKAGLFDSTEKTITIAPDQAPKVDFETVTTLYREPSDNPGEYSEAKIFIQNNSYSLDGDLLNYFVYEFAFDSNNDGSFKDTFSIKSGDYEQNKYYTISNATSDYQFKFKIDEQYNLEVITPFVGKYRFELEGWECYGDSCSKYPIKK